MISDIAKKTQNPQKKSNANMIVKKLDCKTTKHELKEHIITNTFLIFTINLPYDRDTCKYLCICWYVAWPRLQKLHQTKGNSDEAPCAFMHLLICVRVFIFTFADQCILICWSMSGIAFCSGLWEWACQDWRMRIWTMRLNAEAIKTN